MKNDFLAGKLKTFRIVLLCLFVSYVFFNIGSWLVPGHYLSYVSHWYDFQFSRQGYSFEQLSSVTLLERFLNVGAGAPAICALSLSIYWLNKLLKNFEEKSYFSFESTQAYTSFSGYLVVGLILSALEPLFRSIMHFLLLTDQSSQLTLTMDISFGDILSIVLSFVFYAINALVYNGQKLEQEFREFV